MADKEIGSLRTRLSWEDEGADQGLQGFKKDLRGLRSEMALAKSGGKDYSNSMKGMKDQSDILSRQLKTQQERVKELKRRHEESARVTGEDSEQTKKLATQYNRAAAEANRTEGQLKRLNAEIKRQESRWTIAGDKMIATGDTMQKVGGGMSKVGKAWTKGITLPIMGLATAAVAAAKKTGDHADKVVNASQKVGMSTDAYQEYSYALKEMGLEQADVDRALGRLNQRMGRAADGNKKYGDALKAAGISQKDLKDGTYSTDEAFIKIIESLQDVESSQERSSMASEIFGTSMSRKLMPAINGGTEELEALREKSHDVGAVMSGDALESSIEFKNAMDDLKDRGAGLVHELGAKLAPTLTDQLIPVIEDKGIPMLEKMVDKVMDAVDWYINLDDSTKKTVNRLAAFAVAGGPVLSITGKMTSGIGGMVKGAGKLSKKLGAAGGVGLIGSLGSLGPLAVGGVAVAGLAAVSLGIYEMHKKSKEAEEVNLDLAKSLSDQAVELDKNAETFDKLSEKAKISNEELAELNDLNIRISESSNPGEIKELQEQYDELAKNSGLSKEELEELFTANGNIIEQSEDVETSISKQGNAFVENTKAVKEYVNSLFEMSKQELSDELEIARSNANKAIENRKELKKEIAELDEKSRQLRKLDNMDEDERNEILKDRLVDIKQKMADSRTSQEEMNKLRDEEEIIVSYMNDGLATGLMTIKDQRDKLNEKVDKTEEEIDKLRIVNEEYANIIFKQIGINEEGEKGLAQLDKTIEKNQEEIDKLESKKKKTGELSEKDKERLEKLRDSVDEHENAKRKIFEETGLYTDLNGLIDTYLGRLDKENKKKANSLGKSTDIKIEDGNIIDQLDKQNGEHDKAIKKLKEEYNQNGSNKKEIQNQIRELETKKGKNQEVIEKVLRELDIWDDVKDTIQGGADNVDKTKTNTVNLLGRSTDLMLQYVKNNEKTSKGIELEKERTTEAGKDVSKNVDVLPSYDPFDLSKDLSKKDTKTVDLGFNPIRQKFSVPFFKAYAQGTKGAKGHMGGLARVNDGVGNNSGPELIKTPDGQTGMFKGKNVYADLPKGTHVLSAKETRKMIPKYANGTGSSAEFGFKSVKSGLSRFLPGLINNTFTSFKPSAFDFIKNNLTNKLVTIFGGGAGGSKKASSWEGDIRRAAGLMGQSITNAQVQGVISQINRESGGNPGITQSSSVVDINTLMGNPARGLLQYIPQTFNAYRVPGHNNIYSGFDQLLAFFNNRNWRSDLPYGRRGWGPSGGRRYATGTDNHPGGPFLAGEKGWELGRLGNHWEVLNKGVYDRPRGYEVYPHDESKKIMRAIHGMPGYANGTKSSNKISSGSQGNRGDIHQTINIYSPDPTSPADNARKMKQASRQLAMEWR